MQQVQSLGFRLGSAVGWQDTNFNKNLTKHSSQLAATFRRALARRGAFLIHHYTYQHRGVTFVVLLFYRYHQRSRLQKWLVAWLNKREGALSPPPVRNFVLQKLDLYSRKSWLSRRKNLKRVFPKAGVKGFTKLARRSWKIRGWIDLEFRVWNIFKRWPADNLNRHLRLVTLAALPRAEFRAHNIFEFIDAVNPMVATRHYILKRFSKMLYQDDLLESVYLATQLNLSSLLAHTIVLGLERHAGKRQQQRFLQMVRATIERVMSWKQVEARSLWRISVFGKLDAKMRRLHVKMRVGFIRYQEVDFILAYSQEVSRTKFGTSSVRVWMRNLLN